jgi:hypothetical protein
MYLHMDVCLVAKRQPMKFNMYEQLVTVCIKESRIKLYPPLSCYVGKQERCLNMVAIARG